MTHRRNILHYSALLSAVFCLLLVGCGKKTQITQYHIIPEPAYMVQKARTFTITASTCLCFENLGQNTPTAKYIATSLRKMHVRPPLIGTPDNNCILFSLNDTVNSELGDEGYLLQVLPTGIFISANTEAGLFYAFQTLVQMFPPDILESSYRRITIPECTILDTPRFGWRGSHLDVCRHFFSVKQLKRHLDLMASYKLNRLHLHLTDDHGWRIEIEQYPELVDIGAWRVDRTSVPWGYAEPARPGEEPSYGGYYSRSDIAELVEYAAQRNIEIVPEIDLPGHCAALLASHPELSCSGLPQPIALGPTWPDTTIVCVGNETLLPFLFSVFDEVVSLFPSRYIHLGCDEVHKDHWESCPRCQALMHSLHLSNEEQLQGWFIAQIEQHLREHGKQIIGWDDIVSAGGVSTQTIVATQRGDRHTASVATLGHDVIVANPDFCSFDYYQADTLYHPTAFPLTLTLQQAYQFEPLPQGSGSAVAQHVLGAECLLWSDYIISYDQAEYMLLPRLCAFSECLWSSAANKSWPRFRQKVETHKQRFASLGYNYCKGSFRPSVDITPLGADSLLVSLATEPADTYIYYTTDGTDPTIESAVYQQPLHLPHGVLLHTLSIYHGQPQEGVYSYSIR